VNSRLLSYAGLAAASDRARGVISDVRGVSLRVSRSVLERMAVRHPGWLAALLEPPLLPASDAGLDGFLDEVYRRLLDRPVDPDGRSSYRDAVANGMTRAEVVVSIATSEEYQALCRKRRARRPGEDPRDRRGDRYRYLPDPGTWVFEIEDRGDFDWLEQAILDGRYYEAEGVWTLEVDLDKRVMAEIVGTLSQARVLEFGCASGAVLEGLFDQGLEFEGVDISRMAIERASDRVKDRIHHGDLLAVELRTDFDAAFGLDIFEHLNPNRIDSYLSRLASVLIPGGILFANIPVFGPDQVFGETFPLVLPGWRLDAEAGRCFRTVQVDDLGYPVHGHLIWADTHWWVGRFEAAGFVRRPAVEEDLHAKYDTYLLAESPARRPFYVFSRGDCPSERAILERISAPSRALERWPAGKARSPVG
jgi:Methyltransferase domain/Domain of unknown function (DUF4214)